MVNKSPKWDCFPYKRPNWLINGGDPNHLQVRDDPPRYAAEPTGGIRFFVVRKETPGNLTEPCLTALELMKYLWSKKKIGMALRDPW